MKILVKHLVCLLFWAAFCLANAGELLDCAEIDYSRPENWAICDSAPATEAQIFDVIYIYPTLGYLMGDDEYFDWSKPEIEIGARKFIAAGTGFFQGRARVFAPFVRMMGMQVVELCGKSPDDWRKSKMQNGLADSRRALEYYLEHYNNGRPFILYGHSQGAMIWYCLLKDMPKQEEFVAAYLLGLPHITYNQVELDLASKGIAPAKGADDIPVIVTWNTQSTDAECKLFVGAGNIGINPLNWKTDGTPAGKEENIGSDFPQLGQEENVHRVHFCGAVLNPENGALIVDLPTNSEFDVNGYFGKGCFHVYDAWLFSGNMVENAGHRADIWLEKHKSEK